MRYRTKILVSPFGQAYWLGENHTHDEEYFLKTWNILQGRYGFKAQSKSNNSIWELEFLDDNNNVIESPCLTCTHDWIITERNNKYFEYILYDCSKCKLHKSELIWFKIP